MRGEGEKGEGGRRGRGEKGEGGEGGGGRRGGGGGTGRDQVRQNSLWFACVKL